MLFIDGKREGDLRGSVRKISDYESVYTQNIDNGWEKYHQLSTLYVGSEKLDCVWRDTPLQNPFQAFHSGSPK